MTPNLLRRGSRRLVPAVVLCASILAGVALATGNSVPASLVGRTVPAITPAGLEPAFCRANGITPTSLVTGSAATVTGTTGADLLIGSGGAAQTLTGNGGNDCIVAGSVPAGKTTTLNAKSGTS